jgi:tetratricopeptide (TPR) repeat protein
MDRSAHDNSSEPDRRTGRGLDPSAARIEAAQALVDRGIAFMVAGRPMEAVAAYDEVLLRFGDADSPRLAEQAARALVEKAFALALNDRDAEAIVLTNALIARLREDRAPHQPFLLAAALLNKGQALFNQGRCEEAVEVYDTLIAYYQDTHEPALRRCLALALVNKSEALGQLGSAEEAVAVFDELVAHYADDAIEALDEAAARFKTATDSGLREQLVAVLYKRALVFAALHRHVEAAAAIDELIARFPDDDSPLISHVVSLAHDIRDELHNGDAPGSSDERSAGPGCGAGRAPAPHALAVPSRSRSWR